MTVLTSNALWVVGKLYCKVFRVKLGVQLSAQEMLTMWKFVLNPSLLTELCCPVQAKTLRLEVWVSLPCG